MVYKALFLEFKSNNLKSKKIMKDHLMNTNDDLKCRERNVSLENAFRKSNCNNFLNDKSQLTSVSAS